MFYAVGVFNFFKFSTRVEYLFFPFIMSTTIPFKLYLQIMNIDYNLYGVYSLF